MLEPGSFSFSYVCIYTPLCTPNSQEHIKGVYDRCLQGVKEHVGGALNILAVVWGNGCSLALTLTFSHFFRQIIWYSVKEILLSFCLSLGMCV